MPTVNELPGAETLDCSKTCDIAQRVTGMEKRLTALEPVVKATQDGVARIEKLLMVKALAAEPTNPGVNGETKARVDIMWKAVLAIAGLAAAAVIGGLLS